MIPPLTFTPVYQPYLWGGDWIRSRLRPTAPAGVLAESWEVSAHPDGMGVVNAGPLAGQRLADLVASRGEELTGPGSPLFPLLVKILDARLDLSLQVHPDNEGVHEPSEDELCQRAALARVVAIGETGLDYYGMEDRKGGRSIADLEWQRTRFRTHIRAARRCAKPLIIHTRSSADDTLAILREEGEDGSSHCAGGVFHCFTESLEVARAALDLGFYISFSGIVSFKSAQALRDVAAYVPLERLLIETDSPYLAPVPYRGKTNQPAYVAKVAECLAQVRHMPLEALAEASSRNFDQLFFRT